LSIIPKKPVPDSITVSTRAAVVWGTTSPSPSVKNVVPLMYRSVPNPGAAAVEERADPAAQWRPPKATTMLAAQRPRSMSSESGP
jgi:hypothetical protein